MRQVWGQLCQLVSHFPSTGANIIDPSLVVGRELGPQGSLGLWLKRMEMRERKRSTEEGEEKERKLLGAERPGVAGKGERAVFLPGTQCSRGVPRAGQAVFCFGNVTKT